MCHRLTMPRHYQIYASNQATSYSHSNGNTVTQQITNISITNSENKTATYKKPKIAQQQIPNIERSKTTTNKSGIINWSRMAWRSITQDKSPEIISWQQDNRNRFPTAASFFDSVANSKSQLMVNAFADEFAGRPVMFVAEELSIIKQGDRTQTVQFVANTVEALKDIQEFVAQDVMRVITGDTTQTEIFFDNIGKFIEADFDRLREGQATVIGAAIADDFKALANMTPDELAAHLGHEAGDAFLIFLAGGGLQAGGRALTRAMDTAISLSQELMATRTFRSPLLFQFQESTLHSGFPFDAITLQKPIIRRSMVEQIVVNDIIQAEYLRRSLELQKIFTLDGKLVPEVLDKAKRLMKVSNFNEKAPIYKELLNKGNINDWEKYFYKFELNIPHLVDGKIQPLKGEVHFYMNKVTNEVYYGRDYKIKLQLPNLWYKSTVKK